jgi:hypothetical protein
VNPLVPGSSPGGPTISLAGVDRMLEAIVALIIATAALLGSPGPATLSLAAVGATSGIL